MVGLLRDAMVAVVVCLVCLVLLQCKHGRQGGGLINSSMVAVAGRPAAPPATAVPAGEHPRQFACLSSC